MRRIIIGDRVFLVGLRWSLKKEKRQSRSEIIAEAGDEFDRFISSAGQYGLVQTDGLRGKAFSLAAVLKEQDANTVSLYTFKDEFGEKFWWVLGVHYGLISSRTDKVFIKEDEALDFADSVRDTLGFDKVTVYTADESFSRLEEIVAGLSKSTLRAASVLPLHQLTQTLLLKVGAGVLVFMAVCWGVNSLWEYYSRLQRAEASRVSVARKEAKIADVLAHPEKYFLSKWMSAPSPVNFIQTSIPLMLNHPLAANGWRLASLSCSAKSLHATWEQAPFGQYTLLPFGARLDEKSPKLAHSRKARPALPPSSRRVDELLSQEQVVQLLYRFTHQFSLKNRLTFKKREVKKVEKQSVSCPWIVATWELNNLPAYLITDYSAMSKALDIPGIIITEISYSDEKWSMKGELYAK